jgi:LysM repeat protein
MATSGKDGLYHPDVGPFDQDGNYIEALADAPVKKNHFERSQEPAPEKEESRQLVAQTSKEEESTTPRVVSRKVISREVVTKASYTGTPVQREQAKPREPVVISQSRQSSSPPVQSKPKPKPKVTPKPEVAKPKPKAPIRYTVKKNDTLYSLSRKYGKSISAIQKANGLSNNTIIIGSTLLIPQ